MNEDILLRWVLKEIFVISFIFIIFIILFLTFREEKKWKKKKIIR